MSEREIFLAALDREDPAQRAAYLDRVCAGKPELRQRIEQLLRAHQTANTFLDVPALEQMASDEQVLHVLAVTKDAGALGRLDHYEVLEMVGRGSTGVVLKARDTKLQRIVAIKMLSPGLAASLAARGSFVREAQAAAAIRDDHIVSIHAVSDEGPIPYFVMEYVSGTSLAGLIQRKGKLELREVLRIGMQTARGLAAAHAQGLVHRDIKPGNILLDNGVQRVKITDFGLAYAAANAGPLRPGILAGTPMYMSPEQARGEPIDLRTDLFSLGSVLYTLCTGQPPFQVENTQAVLDEVARAAPRPIKETSPDAPDWLCCLIGKLQAQKSCDRFASATEVADLLEHQLALLQQPIAMPSASPSSEDPSHGSKKPPARKGTQPGTIILVATVICLFAGMGAVAAYLRPWPQSPQDHPADGNPAPPAEHPESNRIPVEPLQFDRQAIPPTLLTLAGGGDAAKAPPELVGVLGEGRFLLPKAGRMGWMQQSPEGKTLAVPVDEDLVLFHVQTGKYQQTLKGPGGRVVWISFSRDSRLLAVSTWFDGNNGFVRVWDLASDKILFTKAAPGRKISGVAEFSSDGNCLVGEGSQQLVVWDSHNGQEIQTLPGLTGGCAGLCFSPDGRHLAAAHWGGKNVKVFDWSGQQLRETHTLGQRGAAVAVAYSPDGKVLASGGEEEFTLWDAERLQEIRTIQTPAAQLAFTPDGRTLYATQTNDRLSAVHTWTRWDTLTQDPLPALSVRVSYEPDHALHCLSRDGKTLFVAPAHPSALVLAIDAAQSSRHGHMAPLNAVAISPDGRTLASAGDDRVVKLWDLASASVLHSLVAHTQPVWGLAFSPGGELLATGSRDGTIALWNVESGSQARTLRGHSRSPSRLQFSPDGKTLVACGDGDSIRRWDVASGKEESSLQGHTGGVHCVAFSPNGQLLASGGEDKTVRLHNLAQADWRKLSAPNVINQVAFSPDGQTLAAVCSAPDAALCLWDLKTREEWVCKGHAGDIRGLAFSPIGSLLATGADDGTVKLWDRSVGPASVRTIGPGPFGGAVRAVAFTPDGRYLATANANGLVYLLSVEQACSGDGKAAEGKAVAGD